MNIAYLAPEGYEKQLATEIKDVVGVYDRLLLTRTPLQTSFWAQNIWYDAELFSFSSISQAANYLKNRGRNWALYPYKEHRRAALIQDNLPYISLKPQAFPDGARLNSLGSWTLLDKNTLLAASNCASNYANGQMVFNEIKEGPPSRAYLKLWEALTLYGQYPTAQEKCLEIGASPGGWTWVLAHLQAQVLCIDKAPLAPEIEILSNVQAVRGNAFQMTPQKIGAVDWIFSDVACYPEKLYEWVQLWLESGKCERFICTLKFQVGDTYRSAKQFADIPGSRLMHLHHNKHELTWML